MKIQLAKVLLAWIGVVIIACASVKSPAQSGIESITFGGGGGFTGETKSYTLTAEGKLSEKGIDMKNVESKEMKEVLKKAIDLRTYKLNQPGNMSYFIEIRTKDEVNRIVWPYGSEKADERVTSLYKDLMALTQ